MFFCHDNDDFDYAADADDGNNDVYDDDDDDDNDYNHDHYYDDDVKHSLWKAVCGKVEV